MLGNMKANMGQHVESQIILMSVDHKIYVILFLLKDWFGLVFIHKIYITKITSWVHVHVQVVRYCIYSTFLLPYYTPSNIELNWAIPLNDIHL